MRFALFKRAPGFVSSVIRWHTRSVYSHVAISFSDATFEAVASGFIRSAPLVGVPNGRVAVDLLEYQRPLSYREGKLARECCERLIGSKYDYEMVLAGFTLRYNWEPKRARRRFFCSEAAFLVAAAMDADRLLAARCQPWEFSPEDLNRCPLLRWVETITV